MSKRTKVIKLAKLKRTRRS